MSDKQNWNQIGSQIMGAVNDALQSGDFNNLNGLVRDTVNNAINEAKRQTQNAINSTPYRQYQNKTTNNFNNYQNRNVNYGNQVKVQRQNYKPVPSYTQNNLIPYGRVNKVGSVAGVLYIVFGSIGLTVFSILFLVFGGIFAAGGGIAVTVVQIMGFLTAFFSLMLGHGCKLRTRIRRAKRYAALCGQKMYEDISLIANNTGKSKRFVKKDIKKMLKAGMFPEGHMDEKETCLILSNMVYKTYIDSEKARKVKELEESKQEIKQIETSDNDTQKQLDKLQMEGVDYIYKIRNYNDQIAGEVISNKLYRLENLLKDIFSEVKKQPEKIEQMQRFMEYYLPTTLKLVESYADFDRVREPGEEIINAKSQIENTLDTINEAFNELLNNLFREKVFDVTTDAQVLQTILSKEGLVKDDFGLEREKVLVER